MLDADRGYRQLHTNTMMSTSSDRTVRHGLIVGEPTSVEMEMGSVIWLGSDNRGTTVLLPALACWSIRYLSQLFIPTSIITIRVK